MFSCVSLKRLLFRFTLYIGYSFSLGFFMHHRPMLWENALADCVETAVKHTKVRFFI